jgi:hypothetical protein
VQPALEGFGQDLVDQTVTLDPALAVTVNH